VEERPVTQAFDVSVYLMACARDCLDEPPLFGPRRMIEAAGRLATGAASDPALARLRQRIDERRAALLGMDRDDFARWLDELIAELASEALDRELRGAADDPERPADVVDRFWAAYNAHDAVGAAALYRADGTHSEIAQGRQVRGPEEIAAGLTKFLDSFPDARWEPRRRIVSDGSAAIAYRLTGTLAAPLGPFREPGRKLDLEGVLVIESTDSEISATADYWDAATFTRQMQAAT
jgi:steroid delta-isomerase-like uncharacterized protein